jgi:hypothetical protein
MTINDVRERLVGNTTIGGLCFAENEACRKQSLEIKGN